MRHFALRGLIVIALIFFASAPAAAGKGTISSGKLNLLVYFNYDEQDFSSWEPVLTEFSKLLYDATEKQLQLGTVTFSKCVEHKAEADIWVLNDTSGARATLSGLGVDGQHMTISQTHKSTSGAALGQFGLVHESGHYVWGLLDEYLGFVGTTKVGCNSCATPGNPMFHNCASVSNAVASIMDGGTTASPRNQRHEFCTAASSSFTTTRHNAGGLAAMLPVKNAQEYYRGVSCWEWMVQSGVGNLTAPTSEPTSDIAGHEAVTYETRGGTLSIALVLDRSGSMSGDRIDLAREGGKIGVGLLRDDQRLSVLSFSTSVSTDVPLTIVSSASKTSATTVIDAITSGGGTAIGDALLAANSQFSGASCANVVVLLSDGASNAGVAPSTAAQTLKAAGTKVYTIGVGSSADSSTLTTIANETGGRYFAAQTSAGLRSVFAAIVNESMGRTPTSEASEQAVVAEATNSHSFHVSTFTNRLIMSVGHSNGAQAIAALRDPSGALIEMNTSRSDVTVFTSNSQIVMEVDNPQVGAWTVDVSSPVGDGGFDYDLAIAVESRSLCICGVTQSSASVFPEPIRVSVTVTAGFPVAGATVTARVREPAGTLLPDSITLHDDGSPSNGDMIANDGVYSAHFHGFTTDGDYTFLVDVLSQGGTAGTLGECGSAVTLAEDGAEPITIADFVATTTVSATASGIPALSGGGSLNLSGTTEDLDQQSVKPASLLTAPLLDFSITASLEESVRITAITVDVDQSDDTPVARAKFGLYLDSNQDGLVDTPSVPLATSAIATTGRLQFNGSVDGPLLDVLAGGGVRCLVFAVDPDMTQTKLTLAGYSTSPRDELPPIPWTWIWLLTVGLGGLVLVMRIERPQLIHARAVASCVAVMLFASIFGMASGCGGSGTPVPPPDLSAPSTLQLTMGPADISARGARSRTSVSPAGSTVSVLTSLDPAGSDGRTDPVSDGGDDHGNSAASATQLPGPGAYGGLITEGDTDWFRTPVIAGRTYVVRTVLGTLNDSTILVNDDAGDQVDFNDDDVGRESRVTFVASRSMNVAIRVQAFSSTDEGSYQLIIEEQ